MLIHIFSMHSQTHVNVFNTFQHSYVDLTSGQVKVQQYRSLEPGYVDKVTLLGSDSGQEVLQRVYIKLRIVVCDGHVTIIT